MGTSEVEAAFAAGMAANARQQSVMYEPLAGAVPLRAADQQQPYIPPEPGEKGGEGPGEGAEGVT